MPRIFDEKITDKSPQSSSSEGLFSKGSSSQDSPSTPSLLEKIDSKSSSPDEHDQTYTPENYNKNTNNIDLSDPNITLETVLPDFGGKKWYQLSHLRWLSLYMFIISFSACNAGYDTSLLNGLYSMPDFNNCIGNVKGAVLGALTNGFVFGNIIVAPFNSKLNDYFGRKKTLIIANLILLAGGVVQSCAGAWIHGLPENYKGRDVLGMLIAARMIMGSGTAIMQVAGPAMISEVAFPTHRQVVTTAYNGSWYLGAIVSAWICFGTQHVAHHWNWRIPTILQSIFSILQLTLIPLLVPESPRWLVSVGRLDEARDVLTKHHGGGYPNTEMLVDYELTEIQLSIEQEKAAAATTTYKEFLKTKANMKRLWITVWISIFIQWSGNALTSYYLAKVLDSIGYTKVNQQLIYNAGLMIFSWGCCMIEAFFIIPHIRRRTAFNTSLFGMMFCYLIWTVLSAINQERNFEDKSLGKGVLAMIFMFNCFYTLGLNGVSITYLTEILPFTLRAKGFNIMNVVMAITGIFSGFVNPIAMDAIEWKYYIVYCVWLAVECSVCFFTFVETSGRTLEEVAEVFGDGIQDLGTVSGITALEDGKPKTNIETEHREFQ